MLDDAYSIIAQEMARARKQHADPLNIAAVVDSEEVWRAMIGQIYNKY